MTATCNGAVSASCKTCLADGNSRTACHAYGIDCGCSKTMPTGHRRALGIARSSMPQGVTRRAPAVAVSVSIEETSSAKSKFDGMMRCLAAAGTSATATVACHSQAGPNAAALGR